MRGSEFTQSIANLCAIFEKEEVEETAPPTKKRGKKIEKSVKATDKNKRSGKGGVMVKATLLEYSHPMGE